MKVNSAVEGGCERFQVLALDGGGVLGIFSAAVLAGLEKDLGRPIIENFDLIVGTSTGGIIAAGLGAGLSAADIVEFYCAEMGNIFPGRTKLRSIRQLVRPKYHPDGLERALQRVFGGMLLGESRVPLVIPSYDIGENNVYLFKTPHHPRLRRDRLVPIWQVAMATSAAPTFFPAFDLPGEAVRLVDGGVWANNPAMVGVVEAVSMFSQQLAAIRVLSIGTTAEVHARSRDLDHGGLLQWARSPNVVRTLLTGQSIGAFTQVQHLLGSANAHRLNPPAPAGLGRLDAVDPRDLLGKAAYHSRHFCPTYEQVFASHTARAYTPEHGSSAETRRR
jgi:uncharacterized protein